MVDKILSEENKFSSNEVEYVIPIHNLDEDVSKKHLRAFHKLDELGFDRVAIHTALIDTKLDHDKALEKLLKWIKKILFHSRIADFMLYFCY